MKTEKNSPGKPAGNQQQPAARRPTERHGDGREDKHVCGADQDRHGGCGAGGERPRRPLPAAPRGQDCGERPGERRHIAHHLERIIQVERTRSDDRRAEHRAAAGEPHRPTERVGEQQTEQGVDAYHRIAGVFPANDPRCRGHEQRQARRIGRHHAVPVRRRHETEGSKKHAPLLFRREAGQHARCRMQVAGGEQPGMVHVTRGVRTRGISPDV